jgi:uncharacterized protein involved in cysteine biosynthesis
MISFEEMVDGWETIQPDSCHVYFQLISLHQVLVCRMNQILFVVQTKGATSEGTILYKVVPTTGLLLTPILLCGLRCIFLAEQFFDPPASRKVRPID